VEWEKESVQAYKVKVLTETIISYAACALIKPLYHIRRSANKITVNYEICYTTTLALLNLS